MAAHQDDYLPSFLKIRQMTIWQLIKTYWQSNHRLIAYLFLVAVMFLTIALVALDVVFNYWFNYFYNALQAYDQPKVLRLLFFFFILAVIHIVIYVYRYYIAQLFAWWWRKWLTHQFIGRWLQDKGYYYLEHFDKKTDNPDQRLQDDIGALVTRAIDLAIGLVSSVATFFAFIYILWTLSGTLQIPLGSFGTIAISGYLVWVGLLYALAGTFFTFKLGRPLIDLNFKQQRREASFRFAAIDLRAHSDSIALYHGEASQQGILHHLFRKALDNWYLIILRQRLLFWYTASYGQVSVLLPLVVVLPNYFNKVFLLGGLMQSLKAFGSVQDSLSFLVDSYTEIAQWQAIAERLTTFANHLNEVEEKASRENKLSFHKDKDKLIITRQLDLYTPNQELLLKNIDEIFEWGKNYLIQGRSGIGKSTFIKALAGIWPYARGVVIVPLDQKLMFLPQKPYMPIGTLEEAVFFPYQKKPNQLENITNILRSCQLEHLIHRLKESANWSQQLSPGELQRIAFVRVFLQDPDWVFLDESTSMLDLENEKNLYALLKKALPSCSVVSVGHRLSLIPFHDEVVEMSKYAKAPS